MGRSPRTSCPAPCFLSWSWVLLQQSLQALPGLRCPPSTLSFCPLQGNAPSFLWIRRKCRSLQKGSLGPCLESLLFLVLSCSPFFSSPSPRPKLRTGECPGQRPPGQSSQGEVRLRLSSPVPGQVVPSFSHPVALGHSSRTSKPSVWDTHTGHWQEVTSLSSQNLPTDGQDLRTQFP